MNVDLGSPDDVIAANWKASAKSMLEKDAAPDPRSLDIFLRVAEQLFLRLESPVPSFFKTSRQPDSSEELPTQRMICELVKTVLEHGTRMSKDPDEIRRLVGLSDYWDLREQLRLRPAAENSLREAATRAVERALSEERERIHAVLWQELDEMRITLGRRLGLSTLLSLALLVASGFWVTSFIERSTARAEDRVAQAEGRLNKADQDFEHVNTMIVGTQMEMVALTKQVEELKTGSLSQRVDQLEKTVERIEKNEGKSLSVEALDAAPVRSAVEKISKGLLLDGGYLTEARVGAVLEERFDRLIARCRVDGGCVDSASMREFVHTYVDGGVKPLTKELEAIRSQLADSGFLTVSEFTAYRESLGPRLDQIDGGAGGGDAG